MPPLCQLGCWLLLGLPAGPTAPTATGTAAEPKESAAREAAEPKRQAARWAAALLTGDLEALVAFSPPGFSFDGRQVWTAADAKTEWLRALEQRPLRGVELLGIEASTVEAFAQRHGPPPERLAALPRSGLLVVEVNLSGRVVLLFFREGGRHGPGWFAVGVSD